jgi:hypothetical protein
MANGPIDILGDYVYKLTVDFGAELVQIPLVGQGQGGGFAIANISGY